MSTLSILNVGDGDTKLSFSKDNPEERERAKRIVTDMLRRGFCILVEVEVEGRKLYSRVTAFDENTCEYIIAGDPDADAAVLLHKELGDAPAAPAASGRGAGKLRGRRGKRVPADGTRATAVARSAGGCARNTAYVRRSR